jgi:hypothetical protein
MEAEGREGKNQSQSLIALPGQLILWLSLLRCRAGIRQAILVDVGIVVGREVASDNVQPGLEGHRWAP